MKARNFLNSIKQEMNLNTDEELSELLGTSKSSLDKWIQRNKIPDKWKYIIKEKLESKSKYHNHVRSIKNFNYSYIVNGDIYINTSQFDHKEDIKEIIRLLPYAPGNFLKTIKEKLETFEELSKI